MFWQLVHSNIVYMSFICDFLTNPLYLKSTCCQNYHHLSMIKIFVSVTGKKNLVSTVFLFFYFLENNSNSMTYSKRIKNKQCTDLCT